MTTHRTVVVTGITSGMGALFVKRFLADDDTLLASCLIDIDDRHPRSSCQLDHIALELCTELPALHLDTPPAQMSLIMGVHEIGGEPHSAEPLSEPNSKEICHVQASSVNQQNWTHRGSHWGG